MWAWPPLYETSAIKVIQETRILCVSYRWGHEKKTRILALPQFRGYRPGVVDDRRLCLSLWKILDAADVVVAHNGDRFDTKKINGRFFIHGIKPPSEYATIDTLKVARKYLGLDSNKMGDICEYLGIGKKLSTRGRDTWLGCIDGDVRSWKEMEAYNIHDTDLLVEVCAALMEWARSKPNRRRPILSKSYANR
jgi:uncharacterized protein YprB with RNaseH-like and TPR domain